MNDIEIINSDSERLELAGVLNKQNIKELWDQRGSLFTSEPQIVIDLAKLNHCDSAGLAFLLCLQKEAIASGRGLTFVNIPQQMQQLITLSHLDDILNSKQCL